MNVAASSCSGITSTRRLIAAGRGWRVSDIEFRADTEACLLEDRHEDVVIGAIIEGSFRYRSTHGSAILTPGALLLGNAGDPFECTYEHTLGDRCISFYYTPDFFGVGKRNAETNPSDPGPEAEPCAHVLTPSLSLLARETIA